MCVREFNHSPKHNLAPHYHDSYPSRLAVEEEQARERFLRKFASKTGAAPHLPLDEEQVRVPADVVVEEESTPAVHNYTHQLDSLVADQEALASLLSPGDQMKSLPGPPPPSPEVPARTMPVLPSVASRVFEVPHVSPCQTLIP